MTIKVSEAKKALDILNINILKLDNENIYLKWIYLNILDSNNNIEVGVFYKVKSIIYSIDL